MNTTSLVVSAGINAALQTHLFPGDGNEAAGILLCSSAPGERLKLLANKWIPVPHAACQVREPDRISWPGSSIEEAIDHGEAENLCVVLIHSHPGGYFDFSLVDDQSDRVTVRALLAAYGDRHGSAIMTPDGAIKARIYNHALEASVVDLVMVPGADIALWWSDGDMRRPMAFTSEMTTWNSRLSAAVIGASGTGSIVIEQLARLGFGRIVAVEFDIVELRNLNRILNTTRADAEIRLPKVEVMARAVALHRGAGVLIPVASSIMNRDAIIAAAGCDFLFCCVDTLEARYVADLMTIAFLMPAIDMGVVIPVRRQNNRAFIADVVGRIDYVYPGGSSLEERGVYCPETLRAEYLRFNAPAAHQDLLQEGYIKGMVEQAPSVITLNMRAASAAVGELIARLYHFRHEPNRRYARTLFSLAAGDEDFTAEDEFQSSPSPDLARGNAEPLLGLPALASRRKR
ncbi:dinucleotide-utilizing enzyme possibly involved in molybdopterin or thiamin biosynthesis [Mesorhizobium australicum WSM2073]|uniref:Dinucleotide-utilizing enzyme possibly involved in molybdopterin or thiamin biosynthesis n=1 Tax=Mesorhizobium australicum (strain HAMBI 3006 / LMG 24608 / WSM2073) TaxID=754035 RepID=L0KEH1_MESAW|nr:ThiF family adenylyltransferase [Mesorhizobium australicum]AGB43401.1 dinucleotide-utilizing enzyme possibly involved in molybdopterin or thiamin biosynthesis [Mesorhizobium australicum WSM2073]